MFQAKTKRPFWLACLLLIACLGEGQAQSVWTGAISTNWNTAGNWNPATVPGSTASISIPATANQPSLSGNLTIGDGGSITLQSGAVLTVTGSISINGNGQLLLDGGDLNHTGTSFSFPFNNNVSVQINAGKLTTNATNFKVNSLMQMQGGELVANAGLQVHSGRTFTATAGKIRVTGTLDIQSSNSNFFAGSDSLIVNGRINLSSNTNFYGGTAKIVVNRAVGQNNQLSGNWFTQQATVSFLPSNPMGNNLTSISSSGATFRVGQGTVYFADSVFVGNNAFLFVDSGTATFERSVQVSSSGEISNSIGTLNFQGTATFSNSGTLNAGSGQVNFGGDVVVNNSNGSINAQASTIVIEGNVSTPGIFNAGTSTVILAGTGNQVINNSITFFNLEVQTNGNLVANGNVVVLNTGVIGDSTTIDLGNNQFNVQGDLTDNGGNLAVATNKPFVVNAAGLTATSILIEFNEALNSTATIPANYSISPARTITNAQLNGRFVTLTVSTALDNSVEYTITMNNIQNASNVSVDPNHIKRFTFQQISAPSVQASNVLITQPRTDSLTISFTPGNGTRRLVLAREVNASFSAPQPNTTYAANAIFGNGAEIGSGSFVVFNGTGSGFVLRGLTPGQLYHVRVYEYNGNNGLEQYAAAGAAQSANRRTLVNQPTQQAAINITARTVNSISYNLVAGNGDRRLVLAKAGAPVDAVPEQGTTYASSSTFGNGAQLGNGNFVVLNGTAVTGSVSGLAANEVYHFRVFEYNRTADGNEHYRVVDTAVASTFALATQPTISPVNLQLSTVDTGSIQLSFSPGNGTHHLVVARQGSAVSTAANPVAGVVYQANQSFGAGDTIGTADHFVVYSGTDTAFTVNGLLTGTTYHFRVVSFNGINGNPNYRVTSTLNGSRSTLARLPSQQTAIAITSRAATSIALSLTPGDGERRLIIARAGSPVDVAPQNGVSYAASSNFGNGADLGNGHFVVFFGNATTLSVAQLQADTRYYFAAYEVGFTVNGSQHYLMTAPFLVDTFTLATSPAISATNLRFTQIDTGSFRVSFSPGDGQQHIVVARAGTAVSVLPTNGVVYQSNAVFGTGDTIANGQFVVYTGNDTSFILSGLSPGVAYHFRVLPYNGLNNNPVYRSSSTLIGSQAALALLPVAQVGPISFGARTHNSIRITVPLNGADRILIVAREGAPVDAEPQNGVQYTAAAFGSGSEIGNGNFVVRYANSASNLNLTGFKPATVYYFKAYAVGFTVSTSGHFLLTNAPEDSASTLENIPTIRPTDFQVVSVTSTSMQLKWQRGDGDRVIITGRLGNTPSSPVNGIDYAADTVFGSGDNIANTTHTFAVYSGTDTTVTITGLNPNTNYRFRIFEFNGTDLATRYLTSNPVPQISRNTLPANTASLSSVSDVTEQSIRLNFTTGGGAGVLVVAKKGGPVTQFPADEANYPANASFGLGTDLGDSNFVVAQGNLSTVNVLGLEPNERYYFAVFDYSGSNATRSYTSTPSIDTNQHTYIRLQLSLWLQGPYRASADSMRADLTGLLPATQPYNAFPWQYNGSETQQLSNQPVVDWVYIQLRASNAASAATSDSLVYETAALLWSDGRVTDVAGVTSFLAATSRAGNLYAVVYHRNHIPVMTAQPLVFNGSSHSANLGASANAAFGNQALVSLGNGRWGLYAGRMEDSTPFVIDALDREAAWLDRNTTEAYQLTDAALEGVVDASDRTLGWNNRNVSSQVP